MATINYLYPVAGAAPSSRATSTCSQVVAQLVMTDLDTTATISHNFLSSNINPPNLATDLASGFPEVTITYVVAPTTTIATPLAVAVGTNAITITKVSNLGSLFTAIVTIKRPNTLTR